MCLLVVVEFCGSLFVRALLNVVVDSRLLCRCVSIFLLFVVCCCRLLVFVVVCRLSFDFCCFFCVGCRLSVVCCLLVVFCALFVVRRL